MRVATLYFIEDPERMMYQDEHVFDLLRFRIFSMKNLDNF